MLFALSAAQGQGKTTSINGLKFLGINSCEIKTARAILSDWQVTLDQVNSNLTLKSEFQDELIDRHYRSCLEYSASQDVFITERSFADIFAYALVGLGQFNKYDEWVNNYYQKCKEYQKVFVSIFHLQGTTIPPADDGVRSINSHYLKLVDNRIEYYLEDFGVPVIQIQTTNRNKRIIEIYRNIKKVAKDKK